MRKQSFGVGVERSFPVHSPKIERIEISARGDVRRAKLYYLRDRVGKAARVRERGYVGPEEVVEPGLLHAPPAAEPEVPDEQQPDGEAPADGVVTEDGDAVVAGADAAAPTDEAPQADAGGAVEAAPGPADADDATPASSDDPE